VTSSQYELFLAAISRDDETGDEIRSLFADASSLDQFVAAAKHFGFEVSKLDFLSAAYDHQLVKESGIEMFT